jgi:hypothetical protein
MIGIERTYRERLRELASLRSLEAAEPSDEGWIAAAAGAPPLCVAGLNGGSREDLRRVRELGESYPDTPLVVLARSVAIDGWSA